MAASTEPRSGLLFGWALGESGWNVGMDDNLKRIGRFAFHLSVKDRDLATPPASPAIGDTYIVATGGTDAWLGKDKQVAIWDGSVWVFGVPREGWQAFIEDEGVLATYTAGAWNLGVSTSGAETRSTPTSSAGALTLDLKNGTVAETTLTENITALTLSNPPASGKYGKIRWITKQDATGGWTVTWPASVKWGSAGAPTFVTTANTVNTVEFTTTDGGTTWWGETVGLGY